MKKATITIGVAASGKTTWAEQYCKDHPSARIVCRDDIRRQIFKERLPGGFIWRRWDWKWEPDVSKIHTDLIKSYSTDPSVAELIVADTNLSQKFLNQLIRLLKNNGFKVDFKVFEEPIEVLYERDFKRTNYSVGREAIDKQYKAFVELKESGFLKTEQTQSTSNTIMDLFA